jgi:O-antigen ligase
MPAITSAERVRLVALREPEPPARSLPAVQSAGGTTGSAGPNALVRWAFYVSVFAIPFARLYVPGTGDRLGVTRIVQLLLLCAVASQPRVCLRLVPVALFWFVAYCAIRVGSGLWLSPELAASWWPTTFEWIQFSLPWVWIVYNLLQFPSIRRTGLWAFAWGASLCAVLHLLGIGVTAVDNSLEEVRTTVFGENANVVGTSYAVAVVILIGLGMFKDATVGHRLFSFALVALLGIGMAKTGSRTAFFMVGLGVLVLLFRAESFASRTRRYASLLLMGGILAGAVWQVPTVIERFRHIDTQDVGRENPRARMAPVLWEMFFRSPIYGSGPDQYTFELTRRAMPYLIRDQRTIAAHNLVLLLLVETGIIGLIVFSAGFSMVLASAWRARLKPCGLLPLALLLPFLVSGVLLSNPAPHKAFWFVIAYALAGAA